MRTPFPGMDPYLEQPESWQGFHNSLIAAVALDLAPRLRPRYYVATEERTYLYAPDRSTFIGRPDLNVIGPALQEPRASWSVEPMNGAVRVELPIPDHVREAYLEIRQVGSDEVVTVLEILSPTNKRPGEGRRQYEQKRLSVFGTLTNLVEIDLLRARGTHAYVGERPRQPLPHSGQSGAPAAQWRALPLQRASAHLRLPASAATG